MDWSYHKKTGSRPSARSDRPYARPRQVPLKSLAAILVLAQMQLAETSGAGLVAAAEVGEQQSIEQQLEVQEQVEEGLTQQQQLEQQLKQAQALEQKLRARLRARSKDAEADGLEDNDFAINSVEEFVDSDQLEEAGRSGSRPVEEISSKHNTVPVSLSKAQNKKHGAVKPKSLSLKKLSAAQAGHPKAKQANAHPQSHQKKGNVGKKMGSPAAATSKSPAQHHESKKAAPKHGAAPPKKKATSAAASGSADHQHGKPSSLTQANGGSKSHPEVLKNQPHQKSQHMPPKSKQSKSVSVEKKPSHSAAPAKPSLPHHSTGSKHSTAPKAGSSPKQQAKSHSASKSAGLEHQKAPLKHSEPQKARKTIQQRSQFEELPVNDSDDGLTAANSMVMHASQSADPFLALKQATDTKSDNQTEEEKKKKAVQAALASIKSKAKSTTAQPGPQGQKAEKKDASHSKSAPKHKVAEKQPKKEESAQHTASSAKPQQTPQESTTQPKARSALDIEAQAASQLSADALEYSAQTLESSALDKDSLELPDALKEVTVIQPKSELPKEPAKEPKQTKKATVPEKKKDTPKKEVAKEQKKKEAPASPLLKHQTPPKLTNKPAVAEKVTAQKQAENGSMKAQAPKAAKSPTNAHYNLHQVSKPMEQLKNKVNELTQPVIDQFQKEKASKTKMGSDHKQQVNNKPDQKQSSGKKAESSKHEQHKPEHKPADHKLDQVKSENKAKATKSVVDGFKSAQMKGELKVSKAENSKLEHKPTGELLHKTEMHQIESHKPSEAHNPEQQHNKAQQIAKIDSHQLDRDLQKSFAQHKQFNKLLNHKPMSKPAEHSKPIVIAQQQQPTAPKVNKKVTQSKEKYSQAEKASHAAQQAREKADNLEKQRIAMQMKAVNLGNQQDAIKEKRQEEEDKKQLSSKKTVNKQQQGKQQGEVKLNQMDLITQAIKHQKEMAAAAAPTSEVSPSSSRLTAPPVKQDSSVFKVEEDLDMPKAQESQNLAEQNDILSALGGQDSSLQQALTKNAIRIEDISKSETEAREIKKETTANKMGKSISNLNAISKIKQTNEDKKQSSKPPVFDVGAVAKSGDSKKQLDNKMVIPDTKHLIKQISSSKTDEELQQKLDELAIQEKKKEQIVMASTPKEEQEPNKANIEPEQKTRTSAQDMSQLDLAASNFDFSQSVKNSLKNIADQDKMPSGLIPLVDGEPIKPVSALITPAKAAKPSAKPALEKSNGPSSVGENTAASDLIKKLTQKAIKNQKQKQHDAPAPKPSFAPKTDSTPKASLKPATAPKAEQEKKQNVVSKPKQSLTQKSVAAKQSSPPKLAAAPSPVESAATTDAAMKPGKSVESQKPLTTAPKAQNAVVATPSQEDIIKQVLAKAQKQRKQEESEVVVDAEKSGESAVKEAGTSAVGSAAEASFLDDGPLAAAKGDELSRVVPEKDLVGSLGHNMAQKPEVQPQEESIDQEKKKNLAVQSVLNSMKKSQAPAAVKEEKHELEKPKAKVAETPKSDGLTGAMAPPREQKSEAPKVQAIEQPKPVGTDIDLDALTKTLEPQPEKLATKPQEAAQTESLEELMQKFAESDGQQDDQALTDKIIKQVEASDREEAKIKEAKSKETKANSVAQQQPQPQPEPKPVPHAQAQSHPKIKLAKSEPKVATAPEPVKKPQVATPKPQQATKQSLTQKEAVPKPAVQAKAPIKSNDQKGSKKVVGVTTPRQALPQVNGDNKYGEDEMKALDGFGKAFGSQEDFDGPLDAAKLDSEIKPAVKDIKPAVKDAKPATKTAQKASTSAQISQTQAQVPQKPLQHKAAVKPVPHPATRQVPQPAKPRAHNQTKVSKQAEPNMAKNRPQATPNPLKLQTPPKQAVKSTNKPKTTVAVQKPSAPHAAKAPALPHAPKPHIRHSSFLGHKNQLEQKLDEKIKRKLEEEEGAEGEDDEKRVTREIRSVMAQDDAKAEAKKEEPKKEEPKKEEPKKEEAPKEEPKKEEAKKAEEPVKEEKKEKKPATEAPPPPPAAPPKEPEAKKLVGPDAYDVDPIDVYDYYKNDDPYFMRSRSLPRAPVGSRRRHPRYIDEDILESLGPDELMRRLLQDLHIHDEPSSKRAVEYLEQRVQKDSLALTDLVKKAKDLEQASSQIKKTQDLVSTERTKIRDLLEQLISKMNKEKTDREKNALRKLRQLEQEDAVRRAAEQKELMEQEEIARAVVEQEYKKHAKADEVAERYVELKKKDERVQSTLRAVKAEAERVKRELALSRKRAAEAKEAEKKWQEKETEQLGKDKDSLLEKYLRSRSEHESQLRDLEHSMKSKIRSRSLQKLGQMARVSADSFGGDRDRDDPYERAYDYPRMGRSRRPHPDYYDDRRELLDDDLPLDTFDQGSLMDKIKHLKRLQGQGECPDERRDRGSMQLGTMGGSRHLGLDGYDRGRGSAVADLSDLLPPSSQDSGKGTGSGSGSKRVKSEAPAKDDAAEKTEKDEGDYDFDPNDDSDYEFGRVRGLSNQIKHVKQLRRLPPFKDLKAKNATTRSLPSPDLSDADLELVAQKHERGDVSIEVQDKKSEQVTQPAQKQAEKQETQSMSKLDELMKQVKSLTVSEAADTKQPQQQEPASKKI